MTGDAFDVVCVPIGQYERHPGLDADEEAARVTELLGELGGRPVEWPLSPDTPRTAGVVNERLRTWADQDDARSSVLFWVGHGESSEDGAWLATADSPETLRLGGLLPDNLAGFVATEWSYRRHAEDKWAIVVIEACGAERFAELLFSKLLADPRPPHRFAVIGAGAPDGPGTLGDFSRALDDVLTKGYTDCDDAILVSDLVARVETHLPLGVAHPSKLHLVPPIARTRKLPTAVSATMDVYSELQRYVATLSDDEKLHFLPKAQGADQVEQGEPVWYFVGRETERAAIARWLRRNESGLLAVTGRAGSGKSALLGNVLVHSTPTLRDLLAETGLLPQAPPGEFTDEVRFDTVLHLTGMTVDDVLHRLAGAIDVELPVTTPGSAVDLLAEALVQREHTFTVLADALDEAQDPLTTASAILQRCADIPGVRVVVGTRSSTSEGPDLPEPDDEDLLAALGDPETIVVARDANATARYVRLRLAAALTVDDAAVERVAELIRRRDQHFLYARLAVHEFIANPALLDHPEDLLRGDHRSLFATTVTRLTAQWPATAPLLKALALGLGRGLPRTQGVWPTVAAGLADGIPVSDVDIDDVLSAAAPHIMVDREHGQSVYRLAHRTFAEHFADATTAAHHRRITENLATAAEDALPEPPNAYVVHHLAAHAGAAQAWDVLATHPDVLDHLDPDAVAAEVLRTSFGRTDLPPRIAASVSAQRRLAAVPPGWRSVVRAIAMARLSDPAVPPPALLDPNGTNSIHTSNTTSGGTHRSSLVVQSTAVRAHLRMLGLAAPPGHPRSFCSPRDVSGGGVAWARLPTEPVHVVLNAHHGGAYALTTLTLPDGRTLLATGGRDATVRLWDPLTALPVGAPLTGHEDSVFAVTAVPLPDGPTLLASTGADATVRLWDPGTGLPASPPLRGHDGDVFALAAVPVPDGRVLVASGGEDGRLRLWDPVGHDVITSEPLGGPVASIAVTRREDGGVLVAVGSPGRATGRVTPDGTVVHALQEAPTSPLPLVVSVPRADGATTLCAVGKWVTARLAFEELPGGASREWTLPGTMGDTNDLHSLAAFPDEDGAPVVLTGAADGAIRVWRPRTDDQRDALHQLGETLTGHEDTIHALATVPHPSGALVASASADGTVRLWKPEIDDVATPSDTDIPSGEAVAVTAMALLPWPGEDPLLATACLDQALRLWDPRTGTLVFSPELVGQPGDATWLPGHMAVATTELPGGEIRLATGSGHMVGIATRTGDSLRQTYTTVCRMPWHWRKAKKGEKLAEDVITRRVAEFSPIAAMTTARTPDGTTLLVVAGGTRIRFWDFASGRRLRRVVTCGSPVHCVTTVQVGDRTLVAWGEEDGYVRLCDPVSGAAAGAPLAGGHGAVHAVTALPAAEGTCLAAGTTDGTIVIVNPADGSTGRSPTAHDGTIRALATAQTAEYTYLASGGDDRTLALYDMHSDDEYFVPVDMPISSLLYWNESLFVGSHHGLLRVWI